MLNFVAILRLEKKWRQNLHAVIPVRKQKEYKRKKKKYI
jgi:hypothetical protein